MQTLKLFASSDKLFALANDLLRVEQNSLQVADIPVTSPLLNNWSFKIIPSLAVTGTVFGHPDFTDGKRIVSSDVHAVDEELWARSYNRWYRLGRRLEEGDIQHG